jgi:hypothetical protein
LEHVLAEIRARALERKHSGRFLKTRTLFVAQEKNCTYQKSYSNAK